MLIISLGIFSKELSGAGWYVAASRSTNAADGTSPCEIFQPPNRGELIAPWTTGGGADKRRPRQIVDKAVIQLNQKLLGMAYQWFLFIRIFKKVS